jgi:hypothetical protein
LSAAAFLTRSQAKNVPSRSLVQDSGASLAQHGAWARSEISST